MFMLIAFATLAAKPPPVDVRITTLWQLYDYDYESCEDYGYREFVQTCYSVEVATILSGGVTGLWYVGTIIASDVNHYEGHNKEREVWYQRVGKTAGSTDNLPNAVAAILGTADYELTWR